MEKMSGFLEFYRLGCFIGFYFYNFGKKLYKLFLE